MEVSTVEAKAVKPREESVAVARPRLNLDTALRRFLGVGDALAVAVALYLALLVPGRTHGLLAALVALPLMVVLCKLYGLYDRDTKRISHSTVDDLPWLLHAVVIGALIFWLYARYTPVRQLDLGEVLIFVGGMAVLMPVTRAVIRHGASRFIAPDRTLLVGRGEMADTLLRKLRSHPEYRLEVIATLKPASVPAANGHPGNGHPGNGHGNGHNGQAQNGGSHNGTFAVAEELSRLVEQEGINRVMLSAADLDETELDEILRRCRLLSLKVSILPRLSDMLGPAVEIDDVEGVTVLGLSPPRLPRSSRAVKRAIDLLVAGALLILSAPILVLAALAIKLDTRGPVLFRQERIGKAGRRFRLFKLRTMVCDAEQRREALLAQSVDPNWLFLDHDPRITRVGRLLRRLSLDELPQLLNVLGGEMSMVGPRPLIPTEDERVQPWARGRLDLTPGITGYWQVLGRTRIPFEEMVKLDYLYVVNWSLWEDVRLMLKTLPVVLKGRGAN
jgi:exopolysaccharide biosynthesis polyprenyl glycosylphosphotransferase